MQQLLFSLELQQFFWRPISRLLSLGLYLGLILSLLRLIESLSAQALHHGDISGISD
jgi:hypothetical protein